MPEELIDVNIENIEIVRKVNPRNEQTAWRSQGEKYDSRPTNIKNIFQITINYIVKIQYVVKNVEKPF